MAKILITRYESIKLTQDLLRSSYDLYSGGIPPEVILLEEFLKGEPAQLSDYCKETLNSMHRSNLLSDISTLLSGDINNPKYTSYFGKNLALKFSKEIKDIYTTIPKPLEQLYDPLPNGESIEERILSEPFYSEAIKLHMQKLEIMIQILDHAIKKMKNLGFANPDAFDREAYFGNGHGAQLMVNDYPNYIGRPIPSARKLQKWGEETLSNVKTKFKETLEKEVNELFNTYKGLASKDSSDFEVQDAFSSFINKLETLPPEYKSIAFKIQLKPESKNSKYLKDGFTSLLGVMPFDKKQDIYQVFILIPRTPDMADIPSSHGSPVRGRYFSVGAIETIRYSKMGGEFHMEINPASIGALSTDTSLGVYIIKPEQVLELKLSRYLPRYLENWQVKNVNRFYEYLQK